MKISCEFRLKKRVYKECHRCGRGVPCECEYYIPSDIQLCGINSDEKYMCEFTDNECKIKNCPFFK